MGMGFQEVICSPLTKYLIMHIDPKWRFFQTSLNRVPSFLALAYVWAQTKLMIATATD